MKILENNFLNNNNLFVEKIQKIDIINLWNAVPLCGTNEKNLFYVFLKADSIIVKKAMNLKYLSNFKR
ncbi:hypothetical protein ACIQD3_08550 [Peribacillus loiseleuriae]|uniref:hypothetical protein n=1 Tax=Peribacillus loiseleuriae TaxID=1679170 RepID=UPI0038119B64